MDKSLIEVRSIRKLFDTELYLVIYDVHESCRCGSTRGQIQVDGDFLRGQGKSIINRIAEHVESQQEEQSEEE